MLVLQLPYVNGRTAERTRKECTSRGPKAERHKGNQQEAQWWRLKLCYLSMYDQLLHYACADQASAMNQAVKFGDSATSSHQKHGATRWQVQDWSVGDWC